MKQDITTGKSFSAKEFNFGGRLKVLRLLAGLNQEQLADKSDVNRVSINRWETAGQPPALYSVELVAKHLGVSSDYLYHGGRTAFPSKAFWSPAVPANQKYINKLRNDLMDLLPALFNEAEIDHAAIYTISNQDLFVLLWRSKQKEGQRVDVDYLLAAGRSPLSEIVREAVSVSVKSRYDLGELQASNHIEGMHSAESKLGEIFKTRIGINSRLLSDIKEFVDNRSIMNLLEAFGTKIIEDKLGFADIKSLVDFVVYKHPDLYGSSLNDDVDSIKYTIDSYKKNNT